ncbi:MAG: 23S rRNA pseudouridine(1911/1915/1917) synthase RluD [Thiotrichaceae bacterium]|nr:23S rRNA pseudouridine(1911/1915/1917) synthase RluD [Thiotrichaceae bacterium]
MTVTTYLNTKIPLTLSGYRLDKALAELFPDYSRARLQQWIREGQVLVNAVPLRAKDKVLGGEDIQIVAESSEEVTWEAQDLPLNILYEDEDVLVINKPAGLVVHPGAGNAHNTLVNALLFHAPELSDVPRAGIIHRLDKDTSGILVVARNLTAHTSLINQQQAREFKREYQAVIMGVLVSGGTVNAPIDRHPNLRTQMAVVEEGRGRPAITHYRVMQRYRAHTLVRVKLETGRTHQIRVHMLYKRHPIVGDPVYGGRFRIPPASSAEFLETLRTFGRQALHAETLGFVHPRTGEMMEWNAPPPEDMQNLLAALAKDLKEHA